MQNLDIKYWENRYETNQTKWDVGRITPALKDYVDQLPNKNIKILIPGAGNAHELIYMHQIGFTNVTVLDIAKNPLNNIKKQLPEISNDKLLQQDFFSHHDCYDLILEQTFFCALNPNLREKYVLKMKELLNPNGKLVGVLFNQEFVNFEPPFGGSESEYISLFQNHFKIKTLQTANNSIKPREGKELFFIFENK